VTRPAWAAGGYLTVVTFHRVIPDAALREYPIGNIAVTVDEFSWFVEYFRTHYTCTTLATGHRRWTGGERPARPFLAITFDDGQRDNFEHARPILDRVGVPGSFFIPVDAIDSGELLWHDRLGYATRALLTRDRRRALDLAGRLGPVDGLDDRSVGVATIQRAKALTPEGRLKLVACVEGALGDRARPEWDGLMTWDQIRTLACGGHEIGSHSLSHPILTLVDDPQLEREMGGSRSRIEQEVGAPCESFCYPNGDQDERVRAAARRAGYVRAVTTTWGANERGADPWMLRRCDVQSKVAGSPSRLALRLSPRFARLVT
jgi:peptidoglycan/xylan/chitin deacetylase (PgdA/CDA1 family)